MVGKRRGKTLGETGKREKKAKKKGKKTAREKERERRNTRRKGKLGKKCHTKGGGEDSWGKGKEGGERERQYETAAAPLDH